MMTPRLKVLHIRSSFDPGGTETLLLNLFNRKQKQFQIHFVLLKDGSLIDQLNEKEGNRFYRYFRKRFLDFSVLRRMQQLIDVEGIDRIHTHQFIELVYAVCLKLKNPRLQLFHQVHLMFQKKNLAFYLERILSRYFARVITVSNAAKKELSTSFGFEKEKLTVLYNAVELNGSTASSLQQLNARLEQPLDPRRINIVMVANFVWGKDHETIFKAYDTYIRDQLPEVAFYFIGRKTEISERLVAQYLQPADIEQQRMVLCGPIPNAKSLLGAFDLVVMSCFSETFNIAIMEAAVLGKVILASDIPVFQELSDKGRYFQLFRTGDQEDLFQHLQAILPQLSKHSPSEHAQYFQQKFGFSSFVDKLSDIYQNE